MLQRVGQLARAKQRSENVKAAMVAEQSRALAQNCLEWTVQSSNPGKDGELSGSRNASFPHMVINNHGPYP